MADDAKHTIIGTNPKTLDESTNINKWSAYMFDIYSSRSPPALGSVSVQKVEEMARKKMEEQGLLSEQPHALRKITDF